MATPATLAADRTAGPAFVAGHGTARRLIAAGAVAFFVAYPVFAFLRAADVPLLYKAAWLAALALGGLAPRLGLGVLFAVPFMPVLAQLAFAPQALVHLAVLSQALPWLLRVASGRVPLRQDVVGWAWLAFVAVAAASLVPTLAAASLWFDTLGDAGRELNGVLADYFTARPGPGLVNVFVAFTTLTDGLLTYAMFRSVLPETRRVRAVRTLAAIAVVISLFGLSQFLWRWGLPAMWRLNDPEITRINSTFTDPNALAAYLALMLPILGGLVGAARSARTRAAWTIGLVLSLVALVSTAGRVGYFGTIVGFLVLTLGAIAIGLDRGAREAFVRRYFRKVTGAGLVALVVATIAFTAIGTARDVRHSDQSSYLHTVLYTLNLRLPLDERLKGRIAIWQTVGLIVRDYPWFGTGVGSIYTMFPYYNRVTNSFPATLRLSAHNTFLNVTAELGVVGLAAWLALLGALGRSATRGLRHEHDPGTAWTRLGLAGGLAGYAITMLSGDRTVLREDLVLLGTVGAIIAAWAPLEVGSSWRRARIVVALLVVGLLLSLPTRADEQQERVPLERVQWGFHQTEYEGDTEFRWTTGEASFHVPASARRLTLPVRALAPFPQAVEIHFDGRLADKVVLQDHSWVTLKYLLPAARHGRRYHRIELRVSPTWEPSGDERTLGVKVGQYWAE